MDLLRASTPLQTVHHALDRTKTLLPSWHLLAFAYDSHWNTTTALHLRKSFLGQLHIHSYPFNRASPVAYISLIDSHSNSLPNSTYFIRFKVFPSLPLHAWLTTTKRILLNYTSVKCHLWVTWWYKSQFPIKLVSVPRETLSQTLHCLSSTMFYIFSILPQTNAEKLYHTLSGSDPFTHFGLYR